MRTTICWRPPLDLEAPGLSLYSLQVYPALSTPQRKWPMLRQQSQKCASLAAKFLFTSYKRTWLSHFLQLVVIVLRHYHSCLQQSHAAKRLLPQLEVNLCCHVTVTQWRPILELSAPKFRKLPLQAMQRTWVHGKLKIAWTRTVNPALAQRECHIGK